MAESHRVFAMIKFTSRLHIRAALSFSAEEKHTAGQRAVLRKQPCFENDAFHHNPRLFWDEVLADSRFTVGFK